MEKNKEKTKKKKVPECKKCGEVFSYRQKPMEAPVDMC